MTFQYLNKVERTKIPTPIAKKRIIFFKRSEDTKPNFIEHEDENLDEDHDEVVRKISKPYIARGRRNSKTPK